MLDPEAKGDRLEQELQVLVSALTLKKLPCFWTSIFSPEEWGYPLLCSALSPVLRD